VRTKVGTDLMELAKKKGELEIGALPAANLAHLKEAAMIKKKRNLGEIVKRTGDQKNLLYLVFRSKLPINCLNRIKRKN